MQRSLSFALTGLLAAACSPPAAPHSDQDPTQSSAEVSAGPIEGTSACADAAFGIETRDYQLWLHSSDGGSLYTVKSHDGRVLAERIDAAELGRAYPELAGLMSDSIDAVGIDAIGIGY